MPRVTTGEQIVLDELSRKLDEIEKTCPMTGSYERVDPYIIVKEQGSANVKFVVYHIESKLWYDKFGIDWSMYYLDIDKSVQPGDVVFDLGCNSGFTSAWYGLRVGDTGKVYCFDMMPWNAAATTAQGRINHLSNIIAYPMGVGDKNSSLVIDGVGARTIEGSGTTHPLKVEIKSLIDFASFMPDFIKIDIEGAEHEISNCDFSKLPSVKKMLLEFHPYFINDRGIDPVQTLMNYYDQGFDLYLGHESGAKLSREVLKDHIDHSFFLKKRV